jgi:hypothetical protein
MQKVLKIGELQFADVARKVFCVDLDHGTTLEDVLEPKYWRAVTNHLQRGTRIEVSAIDGTVYADLIVYDVGLGWAKVKLHHVSRHEPNESTYVHWESVYAIGRNPDGDGVAIRLKTDNSIAGRFFDNDAAIAWMTAKLRG